MAVALGSLRENVAGSLPSTLTVNAAFLQEIKEDNRELTSLLEQLAGAFASRAPSGIEPRRAVDLLSQLRDQIAMHFSLEEAYGYFEDAIAVAPQLSRVAANLRAQHQGLFRRICDLEELAEQWLYHETIDASGRLLRGYDEFLVLFSQHEAAENELIIDSVNGDLGGGD